MIIEIDGIELEIEFEISEGYPETLESPEEHPEITIESIFVDSIDIYDLLHKDKLQEIEEALWEAVSK